VAVVQYALFAVATCAWLEAARSRRAIGLAAASGVVAAFGLEASQILVSARMPGLEDAVVRAAGAITGAMLWSAGLRDATRWGPILLVGATLAAAGLQMLSPFRTASHY